MKSTQSQPKTWALFCLVALVTLIFMTQAFDPFNSVKFWVLFVTGVWLLGMLFAGGSRDFRLTSSPNSEKLLISTVGLFVFALLVDLLVTDVKFTGVFGANQRRTGFLAYLGFALIFLAAAKFAKLESVRTLQIVIFGSSVLMTIYGLLQHFHHDFVKWNNPYNPVLTTLGNPDFSSAVLGIFVVSAFGLFMNFTISKINRVISAGLAILILVVIKFSAVTQGFLAAAVGCGFIFLVWVYQKSKMWGRFTLASGVVGGLLVFLGALQIGPLSKLIFKPSVTYRGDYWRAGFRMLKAHPIFGVGLDRYGSYFGQYRDATQVLRRGPSIMSNAAHNVWIQLAATGGLLLLLSYLALMVFVGWRAVVALKSHSGNKQIVVATVVGLWLTYQAQAFISIDNIGIAVWGWLFGGMIVAISVTQVSETVSSLGKSNNKGPRVSAQKFGSSNFAGTFVTSVLVIISLVFVSFMAKSDIGMKKVSSIQIPKTQQDLIAFNSQIDSQLAIHPIDPHFVDLISQYLVQIGQNFAVGGQLNVAIPMLNKANGLLVKLITEDSRNSSALSTQARLQDTFAQIYSNQKDLKNASIARKLAISDLQRVCELDPLNSTDWLQLGKAYKAAGDIASAKSVIGKIAAFDPNGADLASAKKEFGA
jgi:O-antigen ligase